MNSMITTCLNTLAKNFHTKNRKPINNNAPIVSATFIVNPSIASPHNLSGKREDQSRRKCGTNRRGRGSKVEDREKSISILDLLPSILDLFRLFRVSPYS